jgi:hypothetical protein
MTLQLPSQMGLNKYHLFVSKFNFFNFYKKIKRDKLVIRYTVKLTNDSNAELKDLKIGFYYPLYIHYDSVQSTAYNVTSFPVGDTTNYAYVHF